MLAHCRSCRAIAMSSHSASASFFSWFLYVVTFLLLQPLQHYPCQATQQQPTSLGVHIVRSPESAVAPKGDEVVFECELNLAPDRLEWRFRHSSSRARDARYFRYLNIEDGYNITNEENISKLRIFVAHETLGDYHCVAWFGSAAIASTSARLTLVSISVNNSNGYTHSTIRWSVAPKNCILLRCGTVTSNPPAVWSFYRNGEKVPQNEILPTNGALILNSVSAKDSGNYTCSAMNAINGDEVRLPQRIDVRVDYTDRTPPYFLIQPSLNVTARPGDTVVLECPGVGSPPPEAVWSSPNVRNIYHNRTKMLPYGLQITDVQPDDRGSYICRLDNGIAPPLVINIILNVLEQPKIKHGPAATLTNEGDMLELECVVAGNPAPDIFWLINGEDTALDNSTYREERHLIINRVEKRHAGIVQCFAKNEVGETSEGNLLRVNPKQIQGEIGSTPLGNVPTRSSYEHMSNKNKGRRKHMPNMIPPSRPNVTRLSDDSVMLRWYVPKNEGLPIEFFKVQYRMLGDAFRKIPRENWQTTNEEIRYGKRDRNFEGVKNFTSSVSGLRPDRYYRFRIIAVYSNNDNKEGNTSAKFFLQRGSALGPTKSTLPAPETVRCEAISETAIILYWTLPANPANLVDGFYAYYRPASSAGEYLKATVDGMQTRKFKIDMLEPGTTYEFKLQSFNDMAASEFSTILQGKTKKLAVAPAPTAPAVIPTTKANEDDNSIYPVVAGAAGGGILLLIATVAACLCMKRRKNSQPEDEDKPQLDHIQADFVTPAVLGVSSHHKSSGGGTVGLRLNGVIPRMNITPNPLAQEADKNRNVMELRFMPNTNNTTDTKLPTSQEQQQHLEANDVNDDDDEDEPLNDDHLPKHQQHRSSSSCETLEASEGITQTNSNTHHQKHSNGDAMDPDSPLSKPLPPLPTKIGATAAATKMNHTIPQKICANKTQQANNANHHQQHHTHATSATTNHAHAKHLNTHQINSNLNNSQTQQLATGGAGHQGIHHAQPYHAHQTPPSGTPTMLHKRDYQMSHHPNQSQSHPHHNQHPPPVPPHQNHNNNNHINNNHNNNNNNNNNHHHYNAHHHNAYQQQQQQPSVQQRTLERSRNNIMGNNAAALPHDAAMNIDGLPTRIPSLRRTRRTSANNNNNNGGVGIPIVPGSPRVQRSPMPARAIMKRNRLGSHNDNISSGSLNSIEV